MAVYDLDSKLMYLSSSSHSPNSMDQAAYRYSAPPLHSHHYHQAPPPQPQQPSVYDQELYPVPTPYFGADPDQTGGAYEREELELNPIKQAHNRISRSSSAVPMTRTAANWRQVDAAIAPSAVSR